MSKRRIRIPFQPLEFNSKHLAVPKELIINTTTGRAYVKHPTKDTEIEYLAASGVISYINIKINEILVDGADSEYNTVEKVAAFVTELETWINAMQSDNDDGLVNTISEVIAKFKDMKESDRDIIESLNDLVNKEDGKVLSSNDLTNELLDKLNGVDDNANLYIHPQEKVCNFKPSVTSVNGLPPGHIMLTKLNIKGLENIDNNANFYEHPQLQQCSKIFNVQTINGMDGDVTFTDKSLVDLGNVENMVLDNTSDIADLVAKTDVYLSGSKAKDMIKSYIEENNLG